MDLISLNEFFHQIVVFINLFVTVEIFSYEDWSLVELIVFCLCQTAFFLSFPFSETGVDEDEDLYDCVYGEDEGGEVYEDLMKDEAAQQPVCFPIPSYF